MLSHIFLLVFVIILVKLFAWFKHIMADPTPVQSVSPDEVISEISTLKIEDFCDELSEKECYMSWLRECRPNFVKTDHQILEWIESIERKDAPFKGKVLRGSARNLDSEFQQNGYEHIVNLGALVYFYQEVDKFEDARDNLEEAKMFISRCEEKKTFPMFYKESFDYVFDILCLFTSNREREVEQKRDEDHPLFFQDAKSLSSITDFESLSLKGQAGVYGMKQFFFGLMRSDDQLHIDLIRKVIDMDPAYHEWYYCLQTVLRYQRRQGNYHHYQTKGDPGEEEKNATLMANRLAPNNVLCMAGEIFLLADMVKVRVSNNLPWTTVTYGDHKFTSMESLVTFVKMQTESILKSCPTQVRINTIICEIFTVLFPYEYRDFVLGKKCLQRCLQYHPYSSKAHHRLGVLYLTNKKYEDALRHFKKAVECSTGEENFPSLACLIQSLMRDAVSRKDELVEIFTKELQYPWTANQLAQLLFLRALFFIKIDNTQEAIDAFIDSYDLDKDTPFDDVPYQIRRYGWDDASINFRSIGTALDNTFADEKDPKRKKTLEMLMKNVVVAIRKEREFRRSYTRSNTRKKSFGTTPETATGKSRKFDRTTKF